MKTLTLFGITYESLSWCGCPFCWLIEKFGRSDDGSEAKASR